MENQVQGNIRGKDLKRQIANFEELVGNILSTGERAGGTNKQAMLDQLIALHTAVEESDLETIAQLASAGADLNAKFDDNVNPQHAGITPLALACATNRVDVVASLLDQGADVNMPFAALNTTSLMTSAYHGHVDVVHLLLERGADVHMVDLQQSTALGYGFGGTRNLDVIQLLLDHNIDVNKKNILGMNALLLVAGYGNEALVEKILRNGADPNTVNDFGHSALHLTVVGKRDLLKKLRKLGTAEAVAADRSLNRRNLDVAIQEWARVHRDEVGGTPEDEEALAKAGAIMMSIGHQLEDSPNEDEDEQAVLQKRVQAVWKHRQENIQKNKEKSKSGIWSLLSCGGGKSSKVDGSNAPTSKPLVTTADPNAASPQKPQSDEYSKLSKSFARILRLLIDAGCLIDRTEKTFGMTALDLAILNGDVESSAVLTSAGADPNHFLRMLSLKELYQAIVAGQRKEVKELVQFDEHLDVNQSFSRFNVDLDSADEGTTPLTLAARQGDLEIVKMLIKKGANVKFMGPAGRFPLAETSVKGDLKMATLLVQNGADLEKTCPAMQDATPVTIASNTQQHKLVEFYLKKGAKVDRPMSDGRIALLRAFESRDMEMVDTILRLSSQNNFSDIQGLTAHLAAKYQSKDRDTEAILEEVSNAVREFQEEEEAIAAEAAAAANAEHDERNQVSFTEPEVFQQTTQPVEAPPERRPPPQERRPPPQERRSPPQERRSPPQPAVQVQQVVHRREEEAAPPSPQEAPPPVPIQERPPQPQRPPPQPRTAPPAEPPQPPQRRPVPEPVQPEAHPEPEAYSDDPPPLPPTSPPHEATPVRLEQVTHAAQPTETSSAKDDSKEEEDQEEEEEEEEGEEGSSSEYETDTDEEEEEEEEEEEGERSPTDPDRPGIIIHKVEQNPPTAMAVRFAGETDIDDMDDPSPHETSDLNENVVKNETETTEEPASPNANSTQPPPVPVTSPPRESTETTI